MSRWLRVLHLYLGVFYAPLLLLFIVTGWWQAVTPNRNKGLGFGQSWIERLSTIHIDQYLPVEGVRKYSTESFKWLVVSMAIGLILTTILGIVMAFRFSKRKWKVFFILLIGMILPLGLLKMGQKAKQSPLRSEAQKEIKLLSR